VIKFLIAEELGLDTPWSLVAEFTDPPSVTHDEEQHDLAQVTGCPSWRRTK
jgi:hypothetical protein